jgi:1-acyl-sn-glycerol-3-phosphate acyltransferase
VWRALRSLAIWTANLSLILAWAPVVAAVRLFDRDPLRRRTARWFRGLSHALAKVNPWRIEISGQEHLQRGQVYVIVSNHQSLADIPVISHLPIDTKWLAKAELFRVPIFGPLMRMAGDIPVERGHPRNAARALLECARYLRQGCSVMFFPEGTRSRDGKVLPFNEGPFQLAIREQVPVLPLSIQGSGNALPRNSWLFGPAQDIRLRVLEPVPTQGWSVKQTAELRDFVRQKIVDSLAASASGPPRSS